MRKLLLGLFLLVGIHGWGQVDSLEFTTRRQVADTVFGLLDPTIYGPALFERSMSEDSLLILQLSGNYSGAAHGWSWLQAYSDIAMSYVDPTFMDSDSLLFRKMENFHLNLPDTSSKDILKQPFGLLLHNISHIDTSLIHAFGTFENEHCQLKLNKAFDENTIYQKVVLKSAALLELYGEHGYTEGTIVYRDDFISTSPDITIQSIQLNVGNGFLPFSAINNEITYSIRKSYQLGQAAVEYVLNGLTKYDTLSFFLTTNIAKHTTLEKSIDRWDTGTQFFPPNSGIEHDLEYRIKFGCGNGRMIRRPVIIAPPYRPILQGVSFNKYYDQFDFKSLISSLSDMGYDVIFIKETPGNRGINHAGGILADFIKYINEQKKENYPNEDWENVVIGFSAGGQHWRYALKKLEKEHMESGTPHHHTRLYIPFDSPHWGANVPMFTQSVYKDLSSVSIMAFFSYQSLKDAASKDMLMNHILGSSISENNHVYTITPAPTAERLNIVNQLDNSFNHFYTPINDLRRSFPTFTRNVAVSTGHNSINYNTQYGLYPGMKLFSQNVFMPTWYGSKTFNRDIYSSQYGMASQVFKREDLQLFIAIPVWFKRHYKTNMAYEWDMAQGGYKDEFYDEGAMNVSDLALSGVPTGAVNIMIANASGILLPIPALWGTQHYHGHISFLPTVSALGINPSIWQNNNLHYNVKDEGLMYQSNYDLTFNIKSNIFGYPNLAHPTNHFSVTPFEAVYCDPQTYEHIKMQASIDENSGMDDVYLVHTRNFILDEVEADVVYLQNKIIGKNHLNWIPNYRYKAWYKAYDQVVFGSNVTPKTDIGPYIIEPTGEITAYACNGVHITTGFHAQNGSKFHAYEHCDGCSRPRQKNEAENPNTDREVNQEKNQISSFEQRDLYVEEQKMDLKVFPNPNSGDFTVVFPEASGEFLISDMNGRIVTQQKVAEENQTSYLSLPKGLYILKWVNNEEIITKKISVL